MKNNKKEAVLKGDLTAQPGKVYDYSEITGNLDASSVDDFATWFPVLKKVGGNLYLSSVTSLPEGFNPTVGGYLDLRSVTSLPKGFNPTVGGYLDLRSVTSSIKGNNPEAVSRARALLMSSFAAMGFSFADGILARIVSNRGPVSRVVICGKTEISFLVTDGELHSHGKTLAEARDGLFFKIGKRDPSEFKKWTLDKVVTKAEAIKAYRIITGACEGGVRSWMETHKTPESVTVKEIIKLTEGAYGAKNFAEFAWRGK